jgi:hypothetical protein
MKGRLCEKMSSFDHGDFDDYGICECRVTRIDTGCHL